MSIISPGFSKVTYGFAVARQTPSERVAGNEQKIPPEPPEQQQEKLEEIQQSLQQLQQIQERSSPDQLAIQRAATLKQRLTILKDILGKLPPGNYKAMLQELKQIARELAALARQLDNPALAAGNLPSMPSAPAEETASADAQTINVTFHHQASNHTPVDHSNADVSTPQPQPSEPVLPISTAEVREKSTAPLQHNPHKNHNQPLRNLLSEAGQTLQLTLELIKIKHRHFDNDSHQAINSVEQELTQLRNSTGTLPIQTVTGTPMRSSISLHA